MQDDNNLVLLEVRKLLVLARFHTPYSLVGKGGIKRGKIRWNERTEQKVDGISERGYLNHA